MGCTQRSSIDCKRGEIHVMTGLNKDKVSVTSRDLERLSHECSLHFAVRKANISRYGIPFAVVCKFLSIKHTK